MKIAFLDTSIFVSAFYKKHPLHDSCLNLLSQRKKYRFITSSHALTEYYSVMTRLPIPIKIDPLVIFSLIEENIVPYIEIASLTSNESVSFLKKASRLQIMGGNIHDFYHLNVAEKAKCDILYTLNTKDFIKFKSEIKILKPE